MYFENEQNFEGVNHKTGERVVVNNIPKSSSNPEIGKIFGKCYDSIGRCVCELHGNCLKQVRLLDLVTNKVEVVYTEKPLIPDAHLQCFFSELSMLLNYRNDKMMKVLPPTDSRQRRDIIYMEQGLEDEAEREKNLIEEEQRRKRKLLEQNEM